MSDEIASAMAGGLLTIDLGALADNWRHLARAAAPAACSAVVKADAYGLGVRRVAPVLFRAGCRSFFVAHLAEGLALRPLLPPEAAIAILNGLQPGGEEPCAEAGLLPVLNGLEQVEAWTALCRRSGRRLPAVLQLDTGMSRLGLAPDEVDRLLAAPGDLATMEVTLVMSHFAAADEPGHPLTALQQARFAALAARFPHCRLSLGNSADTLIAGHPHYDLVRPGVALHGVDPRGDGNGALRPVVGLEARVIQLRAVPAGTAVGYGGTFVTAHASQLATVAVGYADGWPRALSNRGAAFVDGVRVPIAGRVSMDSMTLDVSALPPDRLHLGCLVELIGPHQTLDDVARDAGTIPYEILTSLGRRYARRYIDAV